MSEPLEIQVGDRMQVARRSVANAKPTRQRIRIVYIIDQLTEMGGAERLLVKIIRFLPAEHFHCSIVTFKIDERLSLFSSLPCDVRVLPLRRSYDVRAFRLSLELRRLLRSEAVDIVHTFFETADLWGGLVSHISGVPVLVSSRRDMGILRRSKHVLAYRLVNPLFAKIITVSDEVRRYCIEVDHLKPERVETIYNGVDIKPLPRQNRSVFRVQLGLENYREIVITIGNIRRVKGIDIFLYAASKICRTRPSTLFLIVGDNHDPVYFEELRQIALALRIDGNVLFYGPSEDTARLLAAADVFCLPSRSEGFSNALIEAMGTGLPCVATQVGGNAEAIEHGSNGILVPSENATALALAISGLLESPAQSCSFGRKAMETVRARFTQAAMMAHIIRTYHTLLPRQADNHVQSR